MIPTMTELGKLNSADKVEHKYTYLYDEIFAPMKYLPVRILEIGFGKGRGAKLLAEFFHRGVIHSFSLHPRLNYYAEFPKELQKRIKVYDGDQSNSTSIQKVLNAIADGPTDRNKRGPRKFDLIIDDGSHEPEHQMISFQTLWPHVKDGGMYIIEDFHPAYKNKTHKTVTWLFDKVHELNKFGDKNAPPQLKDIWWIMFAYNQAIVRKTSAASSDLQGN